MGIEPSAQTRDKLIIVETTASWCQFCPATEKQLVSAKEKLKDKITVYQFDHDEGWDQILKRHGGVANALPGVTLFKNGIPIGQIQGHDEKIDMVSWILEKESMQDFDRVKIVDQDNVKVLKNIKDKYVLVLFWNGHHMWGDENRTHAHEAKKALGDRLEIFQYWSHSFTDAAYEQEKKFLKTNNWSKNPYLGLSTILIRNGKVVARYESREVPKDLAEWIQNEGPSVLSDL